MNPSEPNKPFSINDYLWDDSPPASGSAYREVSDASAAIRAYTERPDLFRLNRYAALLTDPPEDGEYLVMDGSSCKTTNDPSELDNVLPYRTARYCFPFELGTSPTAPTSEIVSEHVRAPVAKAMAVRTVLGATLLATPVNWVGAWGHHTVNVPRHDTGTAAGGVALIKSVLTGLKLPHDGLRLVCSPVRAEKLLGRRYDKKKREEYAGVELVVENTHYPTADGRRYAFPENVAVLVYKHADGLNFSTLQYRFAERTVVEVRSDGNAHAGRVVENYQCLLAYPQTGFLFVW